MGWHTTETCIKYLRLPCRRGAKIKDVPRGASGQPTSRDVSTPAFLTFSLHRGGERRFGGCDGLRRADVHPQAFEAQPEQPLTLGGAIKQQRERKGPGGRVREQR